MNRREELYRLTDAYVQNRMTADDIQQFSDALQMEEGQEMLGLILEKQLRERQFENNEDLADKGLRIEAVVIDHLRSGTASEPRILRLRLVRYAAAVLLIAGIGGYLWNRSADDGSVALAQEAYIPYEPAVKNQHSNKEVIVPVLHKATVVNKIQRPAAVNNAGTLRAAGIMLPDYLKKIRLVPAKEYRWFGERQPFVSTFISMADADPCGSFISMININPGNLPVDRHDNRYEFINAITPLSKLGRRTDKNIFARSHSGIAIIKSVSANTQFALDYVSDLSILEKTIKWNKQIIDQDPNDIESRKVYSALSDKSFSVFLKSVRNENYQKFPAAFL